MSRRRGLDWEGRRTRRDRPAGGGLLSARLQLRADLLLAGGSALVVLATFGLGEAMVRIGSPRILDDGLPIILGSPALRSDALGAVRYLPRGQ